MNILQKESQSYKIKVERKLKSFLDREKRQAGKISPFLKEFVERLEEFTLRSSSKRIRAFLVKVGYESVGGRNSNLMVDVSVAIELIHSYLLIHDDIIDQDEWRRQGITVHKYFEKLHRRNMKKGDSAHFGISMAILTGNIGCYLANSLISQSQLPDKQKTLAINRINRLLLETHYGEALDVYNEVKKKTVEKDILLAHKYKTAKYSFEAPLHLGAILGGATTKQLSSLSHYAIPAGLAFQIRDDLLGVFGSRKEIGKPVDSDIREGKQTLLYFEALRRLKTKDRKWLIKHYGKSGLTNQQISKIKRLFQECGSYDYSIKLLKKQADLAKKALKGARQIQAKSARLLMLLSDYLVTRNR